jgi:hypothetical protein
MSRFGRAYTFGVTLIYVFKYNFETWICVVLVVKHTIEEETTWVKTILFI